MKRVLLLVLAVSLVAAACGGDDSAGERTTTIATGLSGEEQALADAIAGIIAADQGSGDPFADPEAAQCFAEGLVEDLGIARLNEIGITSDSASPEEAFATLSESEIGALADRSLGCIDLVAAMAPLFAVDGISEESALCMARGFEETGFYRDAFIAGMTGDDTYDLSADPDFLTKMFTMATECLTADELATIMGG